MKALVVESSLMYQKIFGQPLEAYSLASTITESMNKTLEQKIDFDLTLISMYLNYDNGIESSKALREKHKNKQVPILITSSETDPSLICKTIRNGTSEAISHACI